jgi:hypothetical protein
MARFITIDMLCAAPMDDDLPCGNAWFDTVDKDELEAGRFPRCPACGTSDWVARTPSAPMVLNASLPDGLKRKGFSDQIESLRIEAESYDKPPMERQKHQHEIKKLRSVKK